MQLPSISTSRPYAHRRVNGTGTGVLPRPPPAQAGPTPRMQRFLALPTNKPRIIYISTTGVYGDCAGRAGRRTAGSIHRSTDRAARNSNWRDAGTTSRVVSGKPPPHAATRRTTPPLTTASTSTTSGQGLRGGHGALVGRCGLQRQRWPSWQHARLTSTGWLIFSAATRP